MKRYFILIFIPIILVLIFVWTGYNKNDKQNIQNTNNTSAGTRISTNVNEQNAENRISNILQNETLPQENKTTETEISSYSTVIKDKSAGRLTNISITCSTLNNTIIPAGTTFSFNKTIGEPTTSKGYQEATVIIEHKTEKGIGRWKLPSQ